jgi:hypothetical protein
MCEIIVALIANYTGAQCVLSIAERLWDHVFDRSRGRGIIFAEDTAHVSILIQTKATFPKLNSGPHSLAVMNIENSGFFAQHEVFRL